MGTLLVFAFSRNPKGTPKPLVESHWAVARQAPWVLAGVSVDAQGRLGLGDVKARGFQRLEAPRGRLGIPWLFSGSK